MQTNKFFNALRCVVSGILAAPLVVGFLLILLSYQSGILLSPQLNDDIQMFCCLFLVWVVVDYLIFDLPVDGE